MLGRREVAYNGACCVFVDFRRAGNGLNGIGNDITEDIMCRTVPDENTALFAKSLKSPKYHRTAPADFSRFEDAVVFVQKCVVLIKVY